MSRCFERLENRVYLSANDPDPSLVMHFPLDGNATDMASGFVGTLIGDATFSDNVRAGCSGQSLFLDGSLDKVIVETGNLEIRAPFTVAVWANAAVRRPEATLTFLGSRVDNFGLDLKYHVDQFIRADISNGSQWLAIHDTPVSYDLNEWHHIAAVVDTSAYTLYYDGVAIGGTGLGGNALLLDANHEFTIGAVGPFLFPHGEDFHGWLDDVKVYDRALNAAEIAEAMECDAADSVVAAPDNYNVDEDRTLTVSAADGVLINDSGLEGSTLTATLESGPTNGIVDLNADGSFTYTPAHDFFGIDSFTYTASDGQSVSNEATVTIAVNSVLDATIDVKPGSDPNSINLNSNGMIAVAILTTADFDATAVNAATVMFAGASAAQWALEDVDGDGDTDLVHHFRTQETNLRAIYEQLITEDINADGVLDSNHQEVAVSLTGRTAADELFDGTDEVDLFLSGRALRDLLNELAAEGAI